jgi:hypothetical protein
MGLDFVAFATTKSEPWKWVVIYRRKSRFARQFTVKFCDSKDICGCATHKVAEVNLQNAEAPNPRIGYIYLLAIRAAE